MKRISWMVAVLFLGLVACSSPNNLAGGPQFGVQFGTAEDDVGIDVATNATGRIYTLSTESGPTYEDGYENGTYQRFTLRRFDASGNTTWSRELSYRTCSVYEAYGCDYDRALSLSLDASGNIYAFRTTAHTNYNGYDPTTTSYLVDKYNSSGQFIRTVQVAQHVYGCCDANYLEPSGSLTVDNSGNFYFAGTNCSAVYDADYYEVVGGDCVYVVSKRSSIGSLQWLRTSTTGAGASIAFSSSSSNLYVAGTKGLAKYTTSGSVVWTKAVGPLENVVVSGSNIYTRYRKDIRKFDTNGKQLWLKTQAGLNTIILQDMSGDTSGNVYLSGKYNAGNNNYNPFARKLNSSGTVIWTKTFGTSAYDDARGIATITGSEVYITGETQGGLSHTNIGGRDGYLRKLNSSGNLVWSK